MSIEINEIVKDISIENTDKKKKSKNNELALGYFMLPQQIKGQFIKNYEKIMLNSIRPVIRNYHAVETEDNIFCAICDGGESKIGDLIVICAKCQISVHCKCYSIENVPDSEWLCEFCKRNTRHSPLIRKCQLCSITQGALISTTNGLWVHLTCASYLIPDFIEKRHNIDISTIDKDKFKLRCFS